MKMIDQRLEKEAFPLDQCAEILGIDEFSLLTRIQSGQIIAGRTKSGEIVVPKNELTRLGAFEVINAHEPESSSQFPDERMGIRKSDFNRAGKTDSTHYRVPGCLEKFNHGEIESYRAAFGSIAGEFEALTELRKDLHGDGQVPASGNFEVSTSAAGHWEVLCALLNLQHSEILLCQKGSQCAVIERFQEESFYAQANGCADILMQGADSGELTANFQAAAQHTLEFMASNLVAKAQKVVWEQFPNNRPSEVMAAISERCRQAILPEQTISESLSIGQQPKITHGVRI